MSDYHADHLYRLRHQAQTRFDALMHATDPGVSRGPDWVAISGVEIRLAVDDFKVILTEIRKLK